MAPPTTSSDGASCTPQPTFSSGPNLSKFARHAKEGAATDEPAFDVSLFGDHRSPAVSIAAGASVRRADQPARPSCERNPAGRWRWLSGDHCGHSTPERHCSSAVRRGRMASDRRDALRQPRSTSLCRHGAGHFCAAANPQSAARDPAQT